MRLDEDDLALVERVDDLARNGLPDQATAARRRAAASEALAAVGDRLAAHGHAASPLGPDWSGDVDLYLTEAVAPGDLETRGWIPLDGLLRRMGSPARGRFAIVTDELVVGAADLHRGSPPDPSARVLDRIRRRGEVRLREVLELRALARAGVVLPDDAITTLVADVEAGLGGDVLRAHWSGIERPCPSALPAGPVGRGRRHAGRIRRRLRPRLVVALSGVDGSGKSTLATALADSVEAAGLPVGRVWARPGMNIGWLDHLARTLKRARRQDQAPSVRRVAAGDRAADLPSRRGALGWIWAVLVTIAFAIDVRRQHLRTEGVVIYDRHLADAMATLDFVYAGVDLRIPRMIARRALPRPTMTVYLDVPADVAVARKPGDTFGRHAVEEQLTRYAAWLRAHPVDLVIDASQEADRTATTVLRFLARDA